jgi:hypothetical protein
MLSMPKLNVYLALSLVIKIGNRGLFFIFLYMFFSHRTHTYTHYLLERHIFLLCILLWLLEINYFIISSIISYFSNFPPNFQV